MSEFWRTKWTGYELIGYKTYRQPYFTTTCISQCQLSRFFNLMSAFGYHGNCRSYMLNQSIFSRFLSIFTLLSNCSKIIFILDNFKAHLSVETVEFVSELGISTITFDHSGCSHIYDWWSSRILWESLSHIFYNIIKGLGQTRISIAGTDISEEDFLAYFRSVYKI